MSLFGAASKKSNLLDLDSYLTGRSNLGIKGGSHSTTAGEASGNTLSIATGLSSITTAIVQVLNSGNNVVTTDADITFSAGTIVVADGSSYNTVEGQIIKWIAIGAR